MIIILILLMFYSKCGEYRQDGVRERGKISLQFLELLKLVLE